MLFSILKEASLDYLLRHEDPDMRINPYVKAVVERLATLYESAKGEGDGLMNPGFPWKAMRAEAVDNPQSLGEAHASSAFGQLMRASIQTMANTWYRRYPSTYPQIALEYSSDKRQEWHAPLFGADLPRRIEEGNPFREQQVKGQDLEVINIKWGGMESFPRELFDDDQTGQIRTRSQKLGEGMGVWEGAYFAVRFVGAEDLTTYKDPIPASLWRGVNAIGTAITTPFSVNMYNTDVGNRPAAYGQLTYGRLLDAMQALRKARDPLNVPMMVNPNKIMVSTFDEFNVLALLNSPQFPAVPPTAGGGDVGLMRGIEMTNPIRGRLTPVVDIFVPNGLWAICEANRGFVFQRRDPLEIAQEVPNSGQSFDKDANRFRSRARWEQDWLDPRFAYMGNDGSAELTQP